jgi:hypothetical protein
MISMHPPVTGESSLYRCSAYCNARWLYGRCRVWCEEKANAEVGLPSLAKKQKGCGYFCTVWLSVAWASSSASSSELTIFMLPAILGKMRWNMPAMTSI